MAVDALGSSKLINCPSTTLTHYQKDHYMMLLTALEKEF
jgi:hypothetical protein